MKILLVSSSSSGSGGGELFFLKLAKRFIERGLLVTIAYSEESPFDELASRAESLGCDVIRFEYTRVYDRRYRSLELLLGAKASGIERVNLSKFDVIHVSQQNLEDGIDLVAAIGRVFPDRLIVTIHIVESLGRLGQRMGWMRELYSRIIYRKLQARVRFAFVCGSAMQLFKKITRVNTPLGRVVYNGAECSAPTKVPEDIRLELGIECSDFVVGSVGRLEEQKNYAVLVRAFSRLYAVRKNARLLLVGDGSQRASLENLANSFGLRGRVTITGWVADPGSYLQIMDAFVLPSWFEGFPFALVEAMIAGKKCLASNIPPHAECVGQRDGLLFDASDDFGLAASLNRLSDEDPVLVRLAAEAVEFAKSKFSFDSMVAEMITLYSLPLGVSQPSVESIK